MPLTAIEVKNAEPRSKPYKLGDSGRMHLLVTPAGSKLWCLAHRYDGKEKLLALGVFPEITLKDARVKRDEAKALLAEGVDPGAKRKLDKLTKDISNATTFKALADEYQDRLRREGRAVATLEKNDWLYAHLLPKLGERPNSEISATEILSVLRPVEKRGMLETAKRLRMKIGEVIRFAIATGRAVNDLISQCKMPIRPQIFKNDVRGALVPDTIRR